MNREEDYTIEWKNHASEAFVVLAKLHGDLAFTDVTLHCGERCIRAHRVVLAACSAYLEKVLRRVAENSPPAAGGQTAIVLKDAPADLVEISVGFMYTGVALVPSERLNDFIALAESLEIRGLKSDAASGGGGVDVPRPAPTTAAPQRTVAPAWNPAASNFGRSPALKRKAPTGPNAEVSLRPFPDVDGNVPKQPVGGQRKNEPEEVPAVKSEVYPEDVAWAETDETEEAEYDVNASYPMELVENIPYGVLFETLERLGKHVWRGWCETLGSSGTRIPFCSLCGYRSANVSLVTRHERTHTKEKPFECPTCGKRFRFRSNVYEHSASQHGIALGKKK